MIDLGTLNWSYRAPIFEARVAGREYGSYIDAAVSGNVLIYDGYYTDSNLPDKHIKFYSTDNIGVKYNDYTDATAFKAAMSGVYLWYKKA